MNEESDINKTINEMIANKQIGEDNREAMRFCLLLCRYGWKDKKSIKSMVGVDEKTFEKWWRNLRNNGYFADEGRIDIGDFKDDDELSLNIVMMCLVAEGYVIRINKEDMKCEI